jgi:hypothetical protein
MIFFFLTLVTLSWADTTPVLRNTWVIEEVILRTNAPRPENMPERVFLSESFAKSFENYFLFAKDRADRLTGAPDPEIDYERALLAIKEKIYYVVKDEDELNAFCASGEGRAYVLPSGARIQKVACTAGNETFLVEEIFRKMNVHQQVLLLMYERLTVLKDRHGGKDYKAIGLFTSGLGKMIELAYRQQNADTKALTEAEQQQVFQYYDGLIQLIYMNDEIPEDAYEWTIFKHGGALVKNGAKIDVTAFLGVNTTVWQGASIGALSSIRGTYINGRTSIADNVQIVDSEFDEWGLFRIGAHSVIQNSRISGHDFKFEAFTEIMNSEISMDSLQAGSHLKIIRSKISNSVLTFKLDNDQELLDGNILESMNDYVPAGMEPRQLSFSMHKFKTVCSEKSWDELLKLDYVDSGCFISSRFKEEVDKVLEILDFSSEGLDFKLTHVMERKTIDSIYYARVKELDFSIKTIPVYAEPKGRYFLFDDNKIVPAYAKRGRVLNFGFGHKEKTLEMNNYWAFPLLMENLEASFKKQGADVFRSQLTLMEMMLPIE